MVLLEFVLALLENFVYLLQCCVDLMSFIEKNVYLRIPFGAYVIICLFRCFRNDVIYRLYNSVNAILKLLKVHKIQKLSKKANKNLIRLLQYCDQWNVCVYPVARVFKKSSAKLQFWSGSVHIPRGQKRGRGFTK